MERSLIPFEPEPLLRSLDNFVAVRHRCHYRPFMSLLMTVTCTIRRLEP